MSRNSATAFPGTPRAFDDYQSGFDLSWEVDLWGRIRRSIDLARTDTDLARPILALSTSTAYGFKFSNDAHALVNRIIEKIAELEADMGSRPPQTH